MRASAPRRALALALSLLACARAAPRARSSADPQATVEIRVVALNDFHGQLEPLQRGRRGMVERLGSAPVVASAVRASRRGYEGRFLLLSAGDLVGASPALSGLLQDEPTISFVNGLANARCLPVEPALRADAAAASGDPGCDVVGAIGNHELDEGLGELLRLLRGGNHAAGPFLDDPWRGATWPAVCANLVERDSGRRPFPPAVIREVGGVRLGIVGAVTRTVPDLVRPRAIAGLEVLDEADAVNAAVREIVALGVRAIVVLLHEGGAQERHAGWTRTGSPSPSGAITDIVARLDPQVDVVVAGHSHQFLNAYLPNAGGHPVLVVEAFSAGAAMARIELQVDPSSDEVVAKRAEVIDVPVAATGPDPAAGALVAAANARVGPRLSRVVGVAAAPLDRAGSDSGETALGDLVTDAFRAAVAADVAFVNPGGLRADLPEGAVSWGQLYGALPFGNEVLRVELTGATLRSALEQQWTGRGWPKMLQVSGLTYTWDGSRPRGSRVVEVRVGGRLLEPTARYLVALPSFLAEGGDGFRAFTNAAPPPSGPGDVEALAGYLASLTRPFDPPAGGRILRRDGVQPR